MYSLIYNSSSEYSELILVVHISFLQYVGWYDESSVGGIENSIDKMMAADPNFGKWFLNIFIANKTINL